MKRVSAFLACALAAGCAASHASSSSASSASSVAAKDAVAHVGQPAPDWSENSTQGTLALSSLRGHPVYLNFFATWCPPCNEEAPSINALAKKYEARGLRVVGVDVLENERKAAQFTSEHKLVYPAVVDDGTLRNQYNINGLPVHVFIDRGGIVRNVVVGEMTPAEIEDDVLKLLR